MKDAICFENNKNIIFHSSPFVEPRHLLPGEVHLWIASVHSVPEALLSAQEVEKQRSISLSSVACRFEGARKLLRYLFHLYLKSADAEMETTVQGKPFLKAFPEFHFNITHSQDVVMIALSQGSVGIDLERGKKLNEVAIARRFFAPEELLLINEYQQEQRQEIFFKLWTAKEATLKADGQGIANGMKESVAQMDKEQVSFVHFKKKSWNIYSWKLLEGGDCFFGAVATLFDPTVIHWYDTRVSDRN